MMMMHKHHDDLSDNHTAHMTNLTTSHESDEDSDQDSDDEVTKDTEWAVELRCCVCIEHPVR
jgi:hypothetical protein